ncbi:MAG: HIT family protein, partial [Gammaproteobacteria bacterium]
LWTLVAKGKEAVDKEWNPDGYNIGINVGEAAGQSIHHLHIHVIPRYKGDVENPKGGVRGVIPAQKLYTVKPD